MNPRTRDQEYCVPGFNKRDGSNGLNYKELDSTYSKKLVKKIRL